MQSFAGLQGIWDGNARGAQIFRGAKASPQSPASDVVWGGGDVLITVPRGQLDLAFRVVNVAPVLIEQLVQFYSRAIERKGGEEELWQLFKAVDERIVKVRVTSAADGIQLMFDFGLNEMLPVSQVGHGIHRLITIFSALIASDAKVCVIDEIENGIHHSLLRQIWTGLGAAAEQLGLQVFATTHSYECIDAGYKAFCDSAGSAFHVIQLFRTTDGAEGRVLNQDDVRAALEGGIDLR